MSFQWPQGLWFLLVIPVLMVAYIWSQRRRNKFAIRYASLSLVKDAIGKGPGIRRHIPPALFIIAVTIMIIGLARQQVDVAPNSRQTPVPSAPPIAKGQFAPAIVVLLTDGESNVGPDPLDMAKLAAERGVRVYTIGVGSPEGTILRIQGRAVRTRLD